MKSKDTVKIVKAAKQKWLVMYKGTPKRERGEKKRLLIRNNRGQETVGDIFKVLKEKKKIIQLRFVYLATLSFKNEDEIIVFSNNIKREFIVSRPMLKIKYWGYLFWLNAMIRDGNSNPHERIISTNKYNNF